MARENRPCQEGERAEAQLGKLREELQASMERGQELQRELDLLADRGIQMARERLELTQELKATKDKLGLLEGLGRDVIALFGSQGGYKSVLRISRKLSEMGKLIGKGT